MDTITEYVKTFIEKNKDNYIILVGSEGHWRWASPNPIT